MSSAQVEAAFPHLADRALVLCSVATSGRQLSAGSSRPGSRSATGRSVSFACSPGESCGSARRSTSSRTPIASSSACATIGPASAFRPLLAPITDRIEWMSVESAEMTKHAVNAFLATSVTFINELAALCERVGADAKEVERGLKTETRIGPRAYLSPGRRIRGRHAGARRGVSSRARAATVEPAHAAHGRRAREQHGASRIGRGAGSTSTWGVWRERRSRSGASPTNQARTRFAGRPRWTCAAGSWVRAPACTCHDPAAPRAACRPRRHASGRSA